MPKRPLLPIVLNFVLATPLLAVLVYKVGIPVTAFLLTIVLSACLHNVGAPASLPTPIAHEATSAPNDTGEPLAIEEVIPGKLRVRVFSHAIRTLAGPVPCWTYVSDGLLAEGQEEIALSVKREPDEAERAFPRGPFQLYQSIHGFAARKGLVHQGGTTKLNPARPGFLRDDLHGILYTPGQRLDDVEVPGPFLTAIVLTGPELDVAEQFGAVRLMSLLGSQYRYFPTAPWLDRKRSEIARPKAMASSVLAKTHRMKLRGATVRQDATPGAAGQTLAVGKVVLTLGREAGRDLVEALKNTDPDFAITLLTDLDPAADAILVWEPKETTPGAILKPGATGERIAGNFLTLAAGVAHEGATTIEDGFALLLTTPTWQKVRAAIEQGRAIEVPGTEGMRGFSLVWAEEATGKRDLGE